MRQGPPGRCQDQAAVGARLDQAVAQQVVDLLVVKAGGMQLRGEIRLAGAGGTGLFNGKQQPERGDVLAQRGIGLDIGCLLYTSDAADE